MTAVSYENRQKFTMKITSSLGCSMQAETPLRSRLVEVLSYLHSNTITAHSWVVLCKRRLCYNQGSWRFRRTFIPIQSRLIVVLPHLYRGRSLRLVRLRVLFIATWLLQFGSLPDTIAARRFCATSISADCPTAGQAVCPLCCNRAFSYQQRGLLREIIKNPHVPLLEMWQEYFLLMSIYRELLAR